MIYLKKNVGFWQFGDRLFLDVYVPLLFANIVDMHMYIVLLLAYQKECITLLVLVSLWCGRSSFLPFLELFH